MNKTTAKICIALLILIGILIGIYSLINIRDTINYDPYGAVGYGIGTAVILYFLIYKPAENLYENFITD